MKRFIKKVIHPFYKRYHFWFHKIPRKFRYKNIYTIVQPTVFSPINTISTKVFLDYISRHNLKNKIVLELGCGSGIIAVFAASRGAKVTASDINKIALDSLTSISLKQGYFIDIIHSDLFTNIPSIKFDYILINPPFYPKNPINIAEKAWFCGEKFEFFENLFDQLAGILDPTYTCLMVLSEDCELITIKEMAANNGLILELIHKRQSLLEINMIFRISLNN